MMMVGVFVLVFAGLFVVGIALVAALVMERAAPGLGLFPRSAIAALIGGFLPMIPAALFVMGVEAESSAFEVFLPLLLAGFILTAVFGFPAAFLFSRRRARKRSKPSNLETFE